MGTQKTLLVIKKNYKFFQHNNVKKPDKKAQGTPARQIIAKNIFIKGKSVDIHEKEFRTFFFGALDMDPLFVHRLAIGISSQPLFPGQGQIAGDFLQKRQKDPAGLEGFTQLKLIMKKNLHGKALIIGGNILFQNLINGGWLSLGIGKPEIDVAAVFSHPP